MENIEELLQELQNALKQNPDLVFEIPVEVRRISDEKLNKIIGEFDIVKLDEKTNELLNPLVD